MEATSNRHLQMMAELLTKCYGCLQTEGWLVEKIVYEGERLMSSDPSDWSDCLLDDLKLSFGPAWYDHTTAAWNISSANLEQTFAGHWYVVREFLDSVSAKIYDCDMCKHRLVCQTDQAVVKHYEPINETAA